LHKKRDSTVTFIDLRKNAEKALNIPMANITKYNKTQGIFFAQKEFNKIFGQKNKI
jgi:hypothetical protein